ncbi:glycosyltransferase family 4 protein [Sphingomonas crocodyli]|uniref:Glycosyltransferase family 1 protein n=1 Tax=Sphingomonas crocodyli TaxID=1979270 RepID=A0A437MBC9_9SPHN|nr:glycosyltransferase family 1 protein [Sphingomonas crocodyli]RVT94954.1 glycosyltransferase family 1 protein [Sphingomonas crocodyli]
MNQGSGERFPRNLFVDVSVIARRDAGTGIQRVVRSLWCQLRAVDSDSMNVIPVAGTRRGGYRVIRNDFLERPLSRLPLPFGKARMRPKSGDIFLGLDLAAHIIPYRRSDLLRWRRAGVSLAFILYDMLPIQHPEWFGVSMRTKFAQWLDIVGRQADHVICISKSVADDFREWLTAAVTKRAERPAIAVMRLGAFIRSTESSGGMPLDAQDRLAWARNNRTTLMVGTIEPRKGYDQALAAFEHLWNERQRSDATLLIVGRPGWETEALQHRLRSHPEVGRRLCWIENASDEYLEKLYSACSGLLLTSRGEGFGLPLIEAAVHGKPILARDMTVFREVAPSGVAFFAGDDSVCLAEAMLSWLDGPVVIPASVDLNGWDVTAGDLLAALDMQIDAGWPANMR